MKWKFHAWFKIYRDFAKTNDFFPQTILLCIVGELASAAAGGGSVALAVGVGYLCPNQSLRVYFDLYASDFQKGTFCLTLNFFKP